MKSDITDIKRYLRKYWLSFWLIAVSLMLVCFVSYAAYTNLNSVKRVVSTQGGGGTAFSSDYLYLFPSKTAATAYGRKNITIPQNQDQKTFEVNICNYVQNKPAKYNDNDIEYTFKLTLVDSSGTEIGNKYDSEISVNNEVNFSNGICTIENQTLKGGQTSVNTYTITVHKEFIDNVNIRAEAVPSETSYSYTGNQKLARIFSFSEYDPSATTWTGSFQETTAEGYDGFNYIVKGTGKGTVTITWDSSNLEMNKFFLEEHKTNVTETENKKTLTFEVDSDEIGRYDIQFYKTGSGDYTDLSSMVQFNFKSEETTTTAATVT